MKSLARWLFLIAAAVLVTLAAGTLIPRPLWPETRGFEATSRRILVLSNPIHTDIAFPIDDAVRETFGFVRAAGVPIDAPGARYLIVGWGGRDFYLNTPRWSDLKLVPLLKGITIDRAVMHVDVAGEIPPDAPFVTGFDIDQRQFESLMAFVTGSFVRSQAGPIAIDGFAYGDNDAFYEAQGTFTALLGCNTWTAAALRAGGLRTGWWNPLPTLLTLSVKLYN